MKARVTLHHGLTTIYIGARKTVVYHGGNMGNTIDRSVRPNVDAILGKGTFDKLRKLGTEDGSPDYMYTLTLTTKDYLSVVDA